MLIVYDLFFLPLPCPHKIVCSGWNETEHHWPVSSHLTPQLMRCQGGTRECGVRRGLVSLGVGVRVSDSECHDVALSFCSSTCLHATMLPTTMVMD